MRLSSAAARNVLPLARIKLVTFDVTDTLVQLRHSPGVVYEQVAREHGYSKLCAETLTRQFKATFRSMSQQFPNFGCYTKEIRGWQEWWTQLVRTTFASGAIAANDLDRIAQTLLELYETEHCWKECEGAIELIKDLQRKGIHTGIITNSDPRTATILRNVGFPEFHFVLSAFEAAIEKPRPGIFQRALEMSRVVPEDEDVLVHVGNDFQLDYNAANTVVGWRGVLIDGNLEAPAVDDLKFQNLNQFRELLLSQ